jgi:hypothetical protein
MGYFPIVTLKEYQKDDAHMGRKIYSIWQRIKPNIPR